MNLLALTTDSNARKNLVGNAIYQIIVEKVGPSLAGKVTGMMLDENIVNFTNLLTDRAYFDKLLYEAAQLLSKPGGT